MLTRGVGLQEALEKERQNTQRLLEEKERLAEEKAAERERLAEERTAKALEEAAARHDASNRALYELFVVSHLFIFTQRMRHEWPNMIDS
jgi:regulator of replication initiation timing